MLENICIIKYNNQRLKLYWKWFWI